MSPPLAAHTAAPVADRVIELVAQHYNTTPDAMKKDMADNTPRKVAAYILKDGLQSTLRETRQAVGISCDATVYLWQKAVKKLTASDKETETLIENIKAEVLAMSVSEIHSNSPVVAAENIAIAPGSRIPVKRPRLSYGRNGSSSTAAGAVSDSKAKSRIEKIQKVVSEECLNFNLLKSSDPAREIDLARDVAVYLSAQNSEISRANILEAFGIDENRFYQAIGKIHYLGEIGDPVKTRVAEIRSRFKVRKAKIKI